MALVVIALLLTACGDEQSNGDEYVTDISEDAEDTVYTPEEGYESAVEDTLFIDILEQIERQTRVDEMLLAELDSGAYSFDDPLVVLDPYGMSPLAALALFVSDEPMNISVYVPGRSELTSVYFTFDGYNTRHEVPIYGLHPDKLNRVELTGRTRGGQLRSVMLEIQTDPLPPELAQHILITDLVQPESYQPGFNFTFWYKTAFDKYGEYRWFYNNFDLLVTTLYDYHGHMLFAAGAGLFTEGDVLIIEANMLGKILNVYHSPYGACHDIAETSGGNLIVTGNRGDVAEDFIYEIDAETGEIVNRLDLKRVLQRTRTSGFPEHSPSNWFHHNALVYYNGSIIVSGRHQSAVVKLSWPDGEVEWILSDHSGWNPMFQRYLLTPIGGDFGWSFGQHAPVVLPDLDNDPDTIDILLFDNGNGRFYLDRELQRAIRNNEVAIPENFSRMVHYRINERTMTIEQIWQFGEELGEAFFAEFMSSAQPLENGNRLGAFDRRIFIDEVGVGFSTSFVEVDSSGNIVWETYATSTDGVGTFNTYRAERRPLYTVAANDLRIGVPARVFIPEDRLP